MSASLLSVIGGLVLLIFGGDFLVRGSVQLATRLGVSQLVIGLTLVGFGTSMPELAASVQAAMRGLPGIAYGNVVGSNTANILLIGGIAALVFPMAVATNALRRDGVFMLATAVAFAATAALMPLGRISALVCFFLLSAYLYLAFRQESLDTGDHGAIHAKAVALEGVDPVIKPVAAADPALLRCLAMTLAGLGAVLAGGHLLVDGAVVLAQRLAISETVIGLTIVAVGTSMPELVTSVTAGLRQQGDIAFGNIVGSNIYNILGIAGVTAFLAPGPLAASVVRFDNLVMIGASVVFVIFAWTGKRIGRWEGAALLLAYLIYQFAIWG